MSVYSSPRNVLAFPLLLQVCLRLLLPPLLSWAGQAACPTPRSMLLHQMLSCSSNSPRRWVHGRACVLEGGMLVCVRMCIRCVCVWGGGCRVCAGVEHMSCKSHVHITIVMMTRDPIL